jgi:hypothetical protein
MNRRVIPQLLTRAIPLLLALLVSATPAVAETLDDLLATANAAGSVRVIVKLHAAGMVPEAALRHDQRAILLQRLDIADLHDFTLSTLSGTHYDVIWRYATSPYLALNVSPAALRALAVSPFVEAIAADFVLVPHLAESGPLIQAPDAQAIGVTGQGQAVVVVDDGVERIHPFLAGRVVDEWCVVTAAGGCSATTGAGAAAPIGAHGTHVAGIAAGRGSIFSGVAPAADVIAIRVFGVDGNGTFADVKAALDRVILLKDSRSIAAVNMSLGAAGFTSSVACDAEDAPYGLKDDIDTLRAAGIATVVANGNDGSSTGISYPACISTTIKVGASTKFDTIAFYSDRAPALEASTLFAPGGDPFFTGPVCSSRPAAFFTGEGDCEGSGAGGDYAFSSGTSMATPHVTGAWALLKQVKPAATVDEVLQALRATATALDQDFTGVAYRRINVRDAIGALTGLTVTLSPDKTSPRALGTTIRFTASATGGVGPISYKWLVSDGATLTVAQEWSSSPVFDWTPAAGGEYEVLVWARSGTVSGDGPDGAAASATVPFTITVTPPALSTLSPTMATAGDGGFSLTVTGSQFMSNSVVQWNGATRPTTAISGTELHAAIAAADIATGGTPPVTVFTPGGGTSNSLAFTVINPVPVLTSLAPSSIVAGSASFTLRALGSRFTSTSVIRIDGVGRSTTFVSAGEVTAVIAASEIAAVGTLSVTVSSPAVLGQGGGESSAQSLTITEPPPVPTITSISPTTLPIGAQMRTVTVTGTGFVTSSVVRVNGTTRPTTFVSGTTLTVTLAASDIASAGSLGLRVFTPAPGGGSSNLVTLSVLSPTLTLDRTVTGPTGPVVMTFANGPGTYEWFGLYPAGGGNYVDWQWVNGGRVSWMPTSSGTVTWPTAGGTLAPGDYVIRWWSGGTQIANATFTVVDVPPVPTLTSLEPSTAVAGGPSFTLTARGNGFRATSVIRVGGADRVTTYVSGQSLTTSIAASEIATVGTLSVTVATPSVLGQGGGVSSGATLTITAPPPPPTITSITPASLAPGATARTIAVRGTSFVSASVVQVDGVTRPATFVSATDLTLTLSDADVATPGTHAIRVVTPPPGGGTSNVATLTIAAPTMSLDRTTIGATGPLVMTFANGSGAYEWFGVYPASGGGYVDWQWANGGRVAWASTTNGTLTWPTTGVSLAPGAYVIRWWSAGAQVASVGFTVLDIPPAPTLTSLDPATVVAGGPSFTLTARGNGFRTTSVIRIGGADRATTYVSGQNLTTTIAAAEIETVASLSVTVFTPPVSGQGGGVSSATTLTITPPPPAPTITSISPVSLAPGTSARTVTVRGTDLVNTSVVQVDGVARPTTFTSATELRVTLADTDVATAGTRAIRVVTPPPGGGTSNTVTLTIAAPTMSLDRSTTGPTGPLVLTFANGPGTYEWFGLYPASGSNYVDWQWVNGGRAAWSATTSGTITWMTPGVTLAPGPYVIRWWSAGVQIASASFTVADVPPPVPTVTSISPASLAPGASARTISVRGTGFVSVSVVELDGTARPTTFVSATELRVTLSAADVATAGTRAIRVTTPPSGGGTSNAVTLTIAAPTMSLDRTATAPTGPLAMTFANGPGAYEWFGVYRTSGGGYLDWQWVNGGRTAWTATTSGTITWMTPGVSLAPGTYVIRWWSAGAEIANVAFTVVAP